MQGVRYGPQLCLCNYTMMQMGLTDLDENSVPDVFDVPPVIEFIEVPGLVSDTIFTDDYMLSARGFNDVVENVNPFQKERYPDDMIDYGAVFKKGHYRINGGFAVDIVPSDGKWDESVENLGMFVSGFDPGLNILELELENFVGCRVSAQKEVYLVGLKYYSFSVDSRDNDIVLEWITGSEVFGAGFEISRRDLDTGSEYTAVDTVSVPDEIGYNRRAYSFRDACVIPGHTYRYRLVGRFDFQDGEDTRYFEVPSGELDYRAPFPTFDGHISRICPNPSSGCVSFTVDVPPSYHEVGGYQRSSAVPAAGSVTELKTRVEIMVYDVSGRAVRSLFDLPVFG
ncbi:MAG TPA: hypothetical protein VLA34_12015, partial [Candidatus Krumholzibacterium sp.]|nr:hypothetical protein [Candidatus Krumholzibacterium sp.]